MGKKRAIHNVCIEQSFFGGQQSRVLKSGECKKEKKLKHDGENKNTERAIVVVFFYGLEHKYIDIGELVRRI